MSRPYVPLSENNIKILELGEISVSKLASELTISLNSMWHKVYKQNVKIPKIWYTSIKISPESIKRFKKMKFLKSKMSYKKIGNLYGISGERVREILNREESFRERKII